MLKQKWWDYYDFEHIPSNKWVSCIYKLFGYSIFVFKSDIVDTDKQTLNANRLYCIKNRLLGRVLIPQSSPAETCKFPSKYYYYYLFIKEIYRTHYNIFIPRKKNVFCEKLAISEIKIILLLINIYFFYSSRS